MQLPVNNGNGSGGENQKKNNIWGIKNDGQDKDKHGGRKSIDKPEGKNPEERASAKLLHREIRKDEHQETAQDPEALNMKMGKDKSIEQPNGEIN